MLKTFLINHKIMSNDSDQLMDTSPGGENTQYESQDTFVQPPAKESGQFDGLSISNFFHHHISPFIAAPSFPPHKQLRKTDPSSEEPTEAWQQASREKEERGERTAENVRYGEAISEHGFGGETTGNGGSAERGVGCGGTKDSSQEGEEESGKARKEQGYGEGSGIGG